MRKIPTYVIHNIVAMYIVYMVVKFCDTVCTWMLPDH